MRPLPGPLGAPRRDPGRIVTITLPTGTPLGLSVRRMANSDVVVVTCACDGLRRAVAMAEAQRAGVYVLLGPGPGEDGRLWAYVGKARSVAARIASHAGSAAPAVFLQAALIVSADDILTDEQTTYVEDRLVDHLEATGLVTLANRRGAAGTIREEQRLAAEIFLADALLVLGPVEPWLALVSTTAAAVQATDPPTTEPSRGPEANAAGGGAWLEMRRGKVHAVARRLPGRGLRMVAGSLVSTAASPMLAPRLVRLREGLRLSGGLGTTGDSDLLVLRRDTDFASPTAAASLAAGRPVSGYRAWRPLAAGPSG